MESFELEHVYDEKIAPLMTQIIAICKEHKLPMFATFLYANSDEEGDGLCTTNLMFPERPIPEPLLGLIDIVRRPALRLKVKNKDGQIIEESIIIS